MRRDRVYALEIPHLTKKSPERKKEERRGKDAEEAEKKVSKMKDIRLLIEEANLIKGTHQKERKKYPYQETS